jgi:hypothetical protein
MQAGIESMAVSNAAECMALLTASKRVAADMSIALETPGREWNESLVIREWVGLHAGFEFRGFVRDRHLNALSQYNYAVFYPEVASRKQEIQEQIVRFYHGTSTGLAFLVLSCRAHRHGAAADCRHTTA